MGKILIDLQLVSIKRAVSDIAMNLLFVHVYFIEPRLNIKYKVEISLIWNKFMEINVTYII